MMQVLTNNRARGAIMFLAVLSAGLLFLTGCSGGAKVAVETAVELTGAEKVFAQYVEVTGGPEAYENIKNIKVTGSFSMPAMGLNSPIEAYRTSDGKSYFVMESDAIGKIENGSNGDVLWEMTTMGGAKIKTGEEKAFEERSGDLLLWLRWRDYYSDAVLVGQDEVNEVLCDKIIMTPTTGKPETVWFDAATHLVVKSSIIYTNEMGEIPVDIYVSDYRDVGGMKIPFKIRQVLMKTQEILIISDVVDFNIEIPEGTFDLPADVTALIK